MLLLCLRGFKIDVLALVIHAFIPFHLIMRAARVFKPVIPRFSLHGTFSAILFYHYHRAVHLPGPYNDAHRTHHFLRDATPFDADVYGSGMPEEWCKLVTEISICLLTGLMPWSFTLPLFKQSVDNKLGHVQIDAPHPMGDNFHVRHHEKHFKNFGFAGLPLDLLLGTESGDVSRLENTRGIRCTRHTEELHYVLTMRRTE